ncbi:integrase arm-type DNA-binding domain-containing protein [Pseudomonadales bacterium]|nr:integrase arm-type DNA-binding domain-containing protein [Pseudomonadales bacterium]
MPKLTALEVESLSKLGRYADGDGLYLQVDNAGNKSWLYRFQLNGKRTTLGLGRYDKKTNSLSNARKSLLEKKRLVANGINPSEEKRRLAEVAKSEANAAEQDALQRDMTFERCAHEWYGRKKAQWRNQKHSNQNINTLTQYAFPHFGSKSVSEISLPDIKKCLDPIWEKKTETASRVRSRLEGVLSYAMTSGYRDRDRGNPATWRGQLDQIYPQPEKLKKRRHEQQGTPEHHPAMSYQALPEFYSKLVMKEGIGSLALQFCILTLTRTDSIRFAEWEQVDLAKGVWTVPSSHMKAGIEFRVALSERAISLLKDLKQVDDYIFPGGKIGKPLSDAGMSSVLRRMEVTGATVHGFRSTFRDYVGEETQLNPVLAEHCLAHRVGDATERAYARGDMLAKRFDMVNIWADYVTSMVRKDGSP